MNRDGANLSIWQVVGEISNTDTLSSEKVFDVVVIGAGITGLSTAIKLQEMGKDCIVIDAANIAFGTTGGTTAHLNTIFDSPYNQVIDNFGKGNAILLAEGGKEAIASIKNNTTKHTIDCSFEEVTGYIFSVEEGQNKALTDLVESAKEVGLPMDFINDSPFPIAYLKIASIENQAQINPTKYVFGLAKAFQEAGGLIVENCRATAIDEAEILTVHTNAGPIMARNAVYATHVPPGVNILHFRNAPYRSYVLAVTLKNGVYPKALGYDMCEPYHYYRSETMDGKEYLIAGGEDHKTGHEENTDQCFRKLESYLRKHFDVDQVAYKWSSQFYESADGLPYIGHLPGNRENIYCATGFNGNGITLGSLSGIVLADLIVHGESKYKDLFRPGRVKPVAGFMNFVKESADVVKHFIGDKLGTEKIKSLAELAPGEAKVVQFEGHTLALYKDENQVLHAVNSACTHIKCTVGWNSTEKTWDCPCHGSRFSYDGQLLNAPARADLEKLNLAEM